MSDYTLTIKVDPSKVKQFNNQGWKLCFAAGVQTGSNSRYNVVAYSSSIAQNITIRWSSQYGMAASQDEFNNGIMLQASTDIGDIKFGQSYTLPADWVNGTIQNDPNAPKGGFRFINQTGGAAAVVYKKVQGRYAPIYFSQNAPLPKGTEDLTPVEKVRVWFSSQAQTATMISDFTGDTMDIDFTGTKSNNVQYDTSGNWSVITG